MCVLCIEKEKNDVKNECKNMVFIGKTGSLKNVVVQRLILFLFSHSPFSFVLPSTRLNEDDRPREPGVVCTDQYRGHVDYEPARGGYTRRSYEI